MHTGEQQIDSGATDAANAARRRRCFRIGTLPCGTDISASSVYSEKSASGVEFTCSDYLSYYQIGPRDY